MATECIGTHAYPATCGMQPVAYMIRKDSAYDAEVSVLSVTRSEAIEASVSESSSDLLWKPHIEAPLKDADTSVDTCCRETSKDISVDVH